MIKAVIIAEAGKGIGWGHLSRSLSLYQAFRQKGVSVRLIIDQQGADKLPIPAGVQKSIFNWKEDARRLFREIADSQIVVIDSYLAELPLYKSIALRTELAAYIDDYQRLPYPPGVITNTAPSAQPGMYRKMRNMHLLLGPQYALLRPEYWRVNKRT